MASNRMTGDLDQESMNRVISRYTAAPGSPTSYGQQPQVPRQTPRPSSLPSGQVSQTPGMGPAYTNMGTNVGANIAARQISSRMNPGYSPSPGAQAAGAAAGMVGDYVGGKLKPKEELPTYGGEHGAITDPFGRRFEGAGPGRGGGAARGASYGANPGLIAVTGGLSVPIGALIGFGVGAATRNATSAFSDFSANDAQSAVRQGYQNYLGRDPGEDEVINQLRNQGWNPEGGDRWVGEKGLFHILDSLKASPEGQAFLARGGGATPPSTPQTPGLSAPVSPAGGSPSFPGVTPGATRIGDLPGSAPASKPGQTVMGGGGGSTPYAPPPSPAGGAATSQGFWNPNAPRLDPNTGQYSTPASTGFQTAPGAAPGSPWRGHPGEGAPDPTVENAGLPDFGEFDGVRATFSTPGASPSGAGTPGASQAPALPGGTRNALEGFGGMMQDGRSKLEASDSPKYTFARIAQQFDMKDPAQREAMLQALRNDPSGYFRNATLTRDILDIGQGADPRFNGVTRFDILRDEEGDAALQWAEPGGGGGAAAPMGGGMSGGMGAGGFNPGTIPMGEQGTYSNLVLQYLLQGLGLDRAASRYESGR
jgi:hypothetical protein